MERFDRARELGQQVYGQEKWRQNQRKESEYAKEPQVSHPTLEPRDEVNHVSSHPSYGSAGESEILPACICSKFGGAASDTTTNSIALEVDFVRERESLLRSRSPYIIPIAFNHHYFN